jgi:hypothetical protein
MGREVKIRQGSEPVVEGGRPQSGKERETEHKRGIMEGREKFTLFKVTGMMLGSCERAGKKGTNRCQFLF